MFVEIFKGVKVIKANAVKIAFEIVHGSDIFVEEFGWTLGANLGEKGLAKLSKADRGAIVGLATVWFAEKFGEVARLNVLPVANVITDERGENLFFARICGSFVEKFSEIIFGERGRKAEKIIVFFDASDFAIREHLEEFFAVDGGIGSGGVNGFGLVVRNKIGNNFALQRWQASSCGIFLILCFTMFLRIII